ncbi:hypothetical protein KA012_04790, partial [Candidatus Woesebacteria bacterium]|nr:hypothetical protein [Candidatus Woesebacteria bacterium]
MPKRVDPEPRRTFYSTVSANGPANAAEAFIQSKLERAFRRGEADQGFLLKHFISWAQSPESDARIHHGEFGDFKYLLKENPELLGEIIEAQLHFLITYISSRADGSEKRFAKILNNIETFLQRYAEANADSSQNLHDGIQAVSRSIVLVFRDRIGDDFTRESRTSNALISMVSWLFTQSPLIETMRTKHTKGVKDSETTVPTRDALFQALAKFPYLALAFSVSGESAEGPLTTKANGLDQYISPTSGYISPETRDMLTIALRFWPMLNISPRHLDGAGIQIPKDTQIADAQKRLVQGIWSLFDHGHRNMATKTERELKHLLIALVAGLSPSSLSHISHMLLGNNADFTLSKEMIVAGDAVPALAAEQCSVVRLPEFTRNQAGQYAPSTTVIGVKEAASDILTKTLFTVDKPLNLSHILAMFARLAKTRDEDIADGLIPIRDPKSADFTQDGAGDTDKTLGNAYRRLVDGTAVLYETLVASEKEGPLTLSEEKNKDKLSYFLLSLITLIEILSPKDDEPEEPKAVARERMATLLLRMNRTVDELGPDVKKTIFIPMLALIQDRWPGDVIESLMIQYHAELKHEMTKEGASWQILAQCELPRRLILASPDLLLGEPQRKPDETKQLARLFVDHM